MTAHGRSNRMKPSLYLTGTEIFSLCLGLKRDYTTREPGSFLVWTVALERSAGALSSTIGADNALFAVDLTNPDVCRDGTMIVPTGHIVSSPHKVPVAGACYERLSIANYGADPLDVAFTFQFAADFADIFEVRGKTRAKRGRYLEERIEAGSLHFAYEGRDGVIRRTHVECSPQPQKISSSLMDFAFPLQPKEEATFVLTIACESTGRVRSSRSYDHAFHEAKERSETSKANDCAIEDIQQTIQ